MKKIVDLYQVSLKVLLRNSQGEILALQARPDSSQAGYYDLPGGRIDTDEINIGFAQIIAREIAEEIGQPEYRLNTKIVATGRHIVAAAFSERHQETHVLYLFFVAEYLGGEVKLSNEHSGYKWLDLKKVNLADHFTSGLLEGISSYFESHNNPKTIKFRRTFVDEILAGRKTTTWRLFDDKNLSTSDLVDLLDWESKEKFAEGKITGVREKKIRDLEAADFAGHGEYQPTAELVAEFQKYYGYRVTAETPIKIIDFEILHAGK